MRSTREHSTSRGNHVAHYGSVRDISIGLRGSVAAVCIDNRADCGSCAMKSLCNEVGKDVISAAIPDGLDIKPGDTVKIEASGSQRMRAIALLIAIPLTAMLAVIATLSSLTDVNDAVTALSAIGTVAVTYLVLWCMRNRINAEVTWHITSTNQNQTSL